MKRSIHILVNKSEITAGTRGASLGPEAIMVAARMKGSTIFGEYPVEYVEHQNHLLDEPIKFPFAKKIEGLVRVYLSISQAVKNTMSRNEFPLILAGDHGSAGGTIAGIKAAAPEKRLGVIWIDAHGDLHTPYTTPSGNMHGMPLTTALSEDNLACRKNTISETEISLWNHLKNMQVPGAKINAKDLVYVAVRDTEEEEDELMLRLGIKNHTVDEVRQNTKERTLESIKKQLEDCDWVYVSFDVDSMDPAFTSRGTGTPVENGLMPEEARYFLTELAKWEKTACIEFVEINPCLDEKINKMAEVTLELVEAVTEALEQ